MKQSSFQVVIDACLVIDAFVADAVYHENAVNIIQQCKDLNATMFFPMTGMIEFQRAISRPDVGPRLKREGKWGPGISMPIFKDGISFKYINIDVHFLTEYMDITLPYMKASDYLYLCIAAKECIPLITADDNLLARCQEANIVGIDYKNTTDLTAFVV